MREMSERMSNCHGLCFIKLGNVIQFRKNLGSKRSNDKADKHQSVCQIELLHFNHNTEYLDVLDEQKQKAALICRRSALDSKVLITLYSRLGRSLNISRCMCDC
jgi:hypothetical protein